MISVCKVTTFSLRFTNVLLCFQKIFLWLNSLFAALTSSFRHSLLQRCSVAVLKMLPPIPKNTSIFIYIFIYIDIEFVFDFLVVVVLELQHCNTVTRIFITCYY